MSENLNRKTGKIPVEVNVTTIHETEGEKHTIAQSYDGMLANKGKKTYVFYEEKQEDGSIVRNMIKFSENSVSVTKNGAVEALILYEKDRRYVTSYRGAFGAIPMEFETNELWLTQEEEIRAEIRYDLLSSGTKVSSCHMKMRISEKG